MSKLIGIRVLDMLAASPVPPAVGRHCVGARLDAEFGRPCVLTYRYEVTAVDGVRQFVDEQQFVRWAPLSEVLEPLGLDEWSRRITIDAPQDAPATVVIERFADDEWLERAVAALELGPEIVL